MKLASDELIPFLEARSGLSRVIEEVLGGREVVVTNHGKMTVALVTASQLYKFREMERELNEFLAALEHDKSGGKKGGFRDLYRRYEKARESMKTKKALE